MHHETGTYSKNLQQISLKVKTTNSHVCKKRF